MAPGEHAEGLQPWEGREPRWGSALFPAVVLGGGAAFQMRSGWARGPSPGTGERGPGCASPGQSEFHQPWSPILCFLQILSHLILLSPAPPPGIRTEQDFYVRLIDSMTKQVSFLNSRRRGDSTAAKFGRVKKLATP